MKHNHSISKDKCVLRNIHILKSQLMADIDAQVQIVAESRPLPDGTPNKTMLEAVDKFRVQFDRWINKYFDNAKARMAAYIITPPHHAEMNAKRDWDEQTIYLSFPWYWNPATFTNLVDSVHEYIVSGALYEFFSLTLTSKDPVTADRLMQNEDAFSMIKHCVVSWLPGTQKKKLKPF